MAGLAQPVAGRSPVAICRSPRLDRYAGRAWSLSLKAWQEMKEGKTAALVHRLSGIMLALFLPLHFWALSQALQGEARLESFLRWTDQPLVKASEWAIVLLLAVHLTGGIRILMIEFLAWRDWQKNLAASAAAVALAIGLLFALASTAQAQSSTAQAQSWPQKSVRFIVPFPPGGATDIAARLLGQKLTEGWGQTVVVENRGGASGGVGAAEAARAAPDGYTFFFPSGSVMTANQHIYAKMAYNPEKDFVPVTNVVSGPQVLTVPANSPFKTVKELIESGRAHPGKLLFGHAGIGSQTHLAAENFVYQAKLDAVAVPYRGEAPGLAALVGGETHFFVGNVAGSIGFIKGGRLRALGVTSRTEAPQLPGVPPIAEAVPGFENAGWFGIVAPRGTPKEIIDKVYRDTKTALQDPVMKDKLFAQGLAPVGNTPEEMGRAMKEETALWARVVKERKIKVE
ncbi:MAG: succinate dehydrogenase, cytochrome b556 subunit [Betaproteobacteria bacterium]|nr:succinate dehydrogenase, cytochrome b556 subunit [Betaproteobacteria bacterium]